MAGDEDDRQVAMRGASACWSSSPFSPGIWMSSSRHPSVSCAGSLQELLARRRSPRRGIRAPPEAGRRLLRTDGSSSITKIAGRVSFIASPLSRRQGEPEGGAAVGIVRDPDLATMRLNDRAADGQSQPHAVGLGGHEGLEDLFLLVGRHAGAAVLHGHPHGAAIRPSVRTSTRRLPPAVSFMASRAFITRLSSTCCSWTRSPCTERDAVREVERERHVLQDHLSADKPHDVGHQFVHVQHGGSDSPFRNSERMRRMTSPAR